MGIDINTAGNGDLDDLTVLFEQYRAFYDMRADAAAARRFLAARIGTGESVVFIARDGRRAVGFTQLYPLFSSTRMARMWLLNDLFVAAEARGRGVGAALLERARKHAVDTGACELMLETANDNPARRLYERSGYEQVTDHAFYKMAF